MEKIGQFQTRDYGLAEVWAAHYGDANGPLAVLLKSPDGKLIAKLSVNMSEPDATADSRNLPKNCFYMKDWAENVRISWDAEKSGLFKPRPDLPVAFSGHVWADAWEVIGMEA